MTAAIFSVKQMINASLGSPDAAVVNFRMLSALLQLFAKKMKMLDRKYELHETIPKDGGRPDITFHEVKTTDELLERKESSSKDSLVPLDKKHSISLVTARRESRATIATVTQLEFADLQSQVHDLKADVKELQMGDSILKNSTGDKVQEEKMHFRTTPVIKTLDIEAISDSLTNIRAIARVEALERGMRRVTEIVDSLDISEKQRETDAALAENVKAIKDCLRKIELNKNAIAVLNEQLAAAEANFKRISDGMTTMEERMQSLDERAQQIETDTYKETAMFQENLAEIQYNLEVAIKEVKQSIEGFASDQILIEELTSKMEIVMADVDNNVCDLKTLFIEKGRVGREMSALEDQIANINVCKVDREELLDMLMDKADVAQLNQTVNIEEYYANINKLNTEVEDSNLNIDKVKDEMISAFDEVRGLIDLRAERFKTESVLHDLLDYQEIIKQRLDRAEEILKDHPAAGVVAYYKDCLSCSNPVDLAGGDTGPGFPEFLTRIPPKSQLFSPPTRYCGGPHTAGRPQLAKNILPPGYIYDKEDCDNLPKPPPKPKKAAADCKCHEPEVPVPPCDKKPASQLSQV